MNLPNYTQVSNEFISEMHGISGSAAKVFVAISRKTIGWHKLSDRVSYSQLTELTGIKSTNTLKKAIAELIECKLIEQHESKYGYVYDLAISNIDTPVSKIDTPISNSDTTKETNSKETNTKKDITALQRYTNYFHNHYKKKLGVKPKWGGQECKLLKKDMTRLEEMPDLLKQCIQHFFADDIPEVYEFIAEKKAGYTYAAFHGCLDGILLAVRKIKKQQPAYEIQTDAETLAIAAELRSIRKQKELDGANRKQKEQA